MKRIAQSFFFALIIPIAFWCGGYDFDSRGPTAALCCMFTIAAFTVAYLFPRDMK